MTVIPAHRRQKARTRRGHPAASFQAAWRVDMGIRGIDAKMAGVLWAMKTFGRDEALTNDDIEQRYFELAAGDPEHFPMQKPQGIRSRRKQLEDSVGEHPLVMPCPAQKMNHEGTPVTAWRVTERGWS